ncbi:MAG: UbiA family prenyltransferase [Caulobacteraceae bacterium]
MSRAFAKFLLVGGFAAAVNWGSRFGFSLVLGLSWSIAAAYLLGMITAYGLSRALVFEKSGRSMGEEFLRFALVNVVALAIVEGVTVGLVHWVFPAIGFNWHPEAVAHAIGVASPTVTSYLGHRHFTFGKRRAAPDAAPRETPTSSAERPLPLVVDLDGALLKTDTLVEMAAAGFFRRPFATLWTLRAGLNGRAQLKAALAANDDLDVGLLPFRSDFLAYLKSQRIAGRALHLVSAADQRVVDRVAAELDLFRDARGSQDGVNLKGRRKLAFIQARFPDGFAYAGDSAADLHVWQGADAVLLAGARPDVARRARALGKPMEAEFHAEPQGLRVWARALRLHQWTKNVLIFIPLLLSNHAGLPGALVEAAGFLLMSVAASATYLINDIADLSGDRRHRTKRHRPLASGALPLVQAAIAAPILLLLTLAGAFILSGGFAATLLIYLVLTLSYSMRLKRTPLLDVFVLGALYTLRLVMGTVLSATDFSPWLLTFSAFFFMSMSMAKRHVELLGAQGPSHENLPGRGYRPADAPLTLGLGLAGTVAAVLVIIQYMMAEAFPSDVYRFPAALWATPVLVGLWCSRIWLLAQRGELDEDPVSFAVKDRISLALGATLAATFLIARFL